MCSAGCGHPKWRRNEMAGRHSLESLASWLIRLINWRRNGVFQVSNKLIVGTLVGRAGANVPLSGASRRCRCRPSAQIHFISIALESKILSFDRRAKIQVLRPNDKFIIVVVVAVVVRQNRNRNVRIDLRRYVVCAASDCRRSYASN